MNLELNNEYVTEIFEILCNIPFEQATMHDTEEINQRHAGIEQLIKQMAEAMQSEFDAMA